MLCEIESCFNRIKWPFCVKLILSCCIKVDSTWKLERISINSIRAINNNSCQCEISARREKTRPLFPKRTKERMWQKFSQKLARSIERANVIIILIKSIINSVQLFALTAYNRSWSLCLSLSLFWTVLDFICMYNRHTHKYIHDRQFTHSV